MDLSYLAAVMLAVNLLVFLGICILAVYGIHVAPGRQTAPHNTKIPLRLARRHAATPNKGGK